MKRLLALILTCAMLLTLCACGHSENIPPVTPDVSHEPVEDQTEDPNTPEPSDDSVISSPETEVSPPETPKENEESDESQLVEEPEEYTRTIDPYGKMVALTFDDGPHDTYSRIILDVLEEYNCVATFFEVGRNARAYPDILARMMELGCEVASHTNVHHDLTTLSRDAMLTDLGYADTAIANATGVAPVLVRPPYGAVNKTVKNETGRAMITWTIDTQDWRLRDAQKLFEYFQSIPSLDGEVVLLHSIHGSTAEAMKVVIPWLIEQGYQLVTVSELLAYYYGVLMEPNVFYDQNWFLRHQRTEYPLELPAEPMQTLIPAYTIVPVVPIAPETPTDNPDNPENSGTSEDPESSETPPETPEDSSTPSDDAATESEPPSDDASADDTSSGAENPENGSADTPTDTEDTDTEDTSTEDTSTTDPELPPDASGETEEPEEPVPPGSEG